VASISVNLSIADWVAPLNVIDRVLYGVLLPHRLLLTIRLQGHFFRVPILVYLQLIFIKVIIYYCKATI
jgi:hypothetical protein